MKQSDASKMSEAKEDAYTAVLLDPIYVVRWWRTPTIPQVKRLQKMIEDERARQGHKLHYFGIIHPDEGGPGPELRDALYNFFKAMKGPCHEFHLALLGRGMKNAIVRSVVTGGVIVAGLRGFILVHNSVPAALAALEQSTGKSADMILKRLRREHFVD